MSDEEEDYMSEKFLAGLEDVRPSLVKNRAIKRQNEVVEQQKQHKKRQQEQRQIRTGASNNERLQESLKRPLEADNKGFQMLAKMGYKPGQALGKEAPPADETSASGSTTKRLLEPITVSVKSGRGGFGRDAALKEFAEKRRQLREQRMRKKAGVEIISTEEFRKRATQKAEERFTHGALRRCQLTCENLDTEERVEAPEMPWFWPERPKPEEEDEEEKEEKDVEADEEEDEVEEFTDAEKLEMLTNYLRLSYRFCFWCGVRYKDEEDMESNCPGLTRDDH